MARINSLLPSSIQVDFENLYGGRKEDNKQLTKQKVIKKKKQYGYEEQDESGSLARKKDKTHNEGNSEKVNRDREK